MQGLNFGNSVFSGRKEYILRFTVHKEVLLERREFLGGDV
jgi:hypothetical protein